MVLAASSEAGLEGDPSGLEGLPQAVDMTRLGVKGAGYPGIDPSSHPPRMTWISKQRGSIVPPADQNERGDSWRTIARLVANLSAQLIADVRAEGGAIDSALDAYNSRIAYLRDEATHDGYGLNKRSEDDFKQFVRSRPYMRKGNLVLMDNGNLRAIWKDQQSGRLGLQFLGGNMVQYVIFRRRQADQAISRVAGRDSLEGIERQIDAFQLHSLLGE